MQIPFQNRLTKLGGMGEVARYRDNRNAGWPDGYDGRYSLSRRHRAGRPGIDYRYRPGRPGIDYRIAPNIWENGRPNGAPQTCYCGWHVSHCKCDQYYGRMIMHPRRPPHMVPHPHHPPVWPYDMYDPRHNLGHDPGYYIPPRGARPPRPGWQPPYDPYYDFDDYDDDDEDDDCSTCASIYHPGVHYPIHDDDVSSIISIHSYERQRPTHYHGGHHGHRHRGHGMHGHHYPTHPLPRKFYGSGRRGHPELIQYPHDHRSIAETEESW